VAGHTGAVDDAGESLAGDFDAQCRQTFRNIEKTLVEAGARLSDIVTMTVLLIDTRYTTRISEVRTEIGKDFPASTAITVAGLAQPEMMIEVRCVASSLGSAAAVELRACEPRQEQRRGDIRWRIAGPILDGTSDRIDDVIEIFVPGAGPANISPELQALKRTRSAGQFNALSRLEVSILPVEKRPDCRWRSARVSHLAW
jgi:enamine deaminase RidA (YjgF/YER057c/UK114 family)